MPVPPVADLAGASRSWLDAPSVLDEDALLDELFSTHAAAAPATSGDDLAAFLDQAHQMLDLAGLRGAAMVLAHAGHGNYLGQRSSLTEDGTPGFDVRADHEALFMHAASVGVYCVLISTVVSAPDAWPEDVNRADFLTTAASLVADVAAAATPIHGLVAKMKPGSRTPKPPTAKPASALHGGVVVENEAVVADYLDIDERIALLAGLFDRYVGLVRASPEITTLPPDGIALHSILSYGAALSNLETVFTTYDQPSAGVMSVFAARALIEEAARLHWRYSVQGEDQLKARARQYFDEYRHKQRKAIHTLAGHGIKKSDALRLFDLPANVLTPPGVDNIAKNRQPIPTLASMLRSFSAYDVQSGWLDAAYALLSQVTHATPLGYLHCVRYIEDEWIPNELSGEMLALTLDVAALGSAHSISITGLMLNNSAPAAKANLFKLKSASAAVHRAARRIHGLDLAAPE